MQRLFRIGFILITILGITGIFPPPSYAIEFSKTYLRLDRMTANTPLAGVICATPSTAGAGIEAKVAVTFPNDFTVSQTTTNWSTGTANLPTGATTWPGISTNATTVSGQTVTFASNDLTNASALYCFSFTGNASTTGANGNKSGTITTKDNSNSVINSTNYGVDIIPNDQITVNATVTAYPTDFEATVTSLTNGTTVPQRTVLTYTITYGSHLISPSPLTIEADWSLGQIAGSPTPSVDLLTYVNGSATNAYGNTPPVIDTLNRKISWTIPVFPASTSNQTVTFQLQTTANYTDSSNVAFSVAAHAIGPGTQSADSTISNTYQFVQTLEPTATPGPQAMTTPAAPSSSPTTTPAQPAKITEVIISSIDEKSVGIDITTDKQTQLVVNYGTSLSSLYSQLTLPLFALTHHVQITDLQENTTYYFTIGVTTHEGLRTSSNIYTFTTSSLHRQYSLHIPSLTITSNNIVLFGNQLSEDVSPTIVLITGTPLQFAFRLDNSQTILHVQAIIRNAKTLAANAQESERLDENNIIEIQQGKFLGLVKAPQQIDYFDIYIRVADIYGNLTEQKLASVKTTLPLQVINKDNNQPIEHARVFYRFYNHLSNTYEVISSQAIALDNPSYTNTNGTILTNLPPGSYKIFVTRLGYVDQEKTFTIGYDNQDNYPLVKLAPQPASLFTFLQEYVSAVADNWQQFHESMIALAQSSRFFDVISIAIVLMCSMLALTLFSFGNSLPIYLLPWYILYHSQQLLAFRKDKQLRGYVTQRENGHALKGVQVYVIDNKKHRIIAHATTNNFGEFSITLNSDHTIQLGLTKHGYHTDGFIDMPKEVMERSIHIEMEKTSLFPHSTFGKLWWHLQALSRLLFAMILIVSFGLELLFGAASGWLKAFPFLLLSCITLYLWLLHLRNLYLKYE